MPKTVWELSAMLPAGDDLNVTHARFIALRLATYLEQLLNAAGHPRHEVNYEQPFEHVTGDMLPPDDEGIVKLGPSRPIDL